MVHRRGALEQILKDPTSAGKVHALRVGVRVLVIVRIYCTDFSAAVF